MQNLTQYQDQLVLINDLAAINFQQNLVIKQLQKQKTSLKANFHQKLETFREEVEQKIFNMQKAYAYSLLNVIRNRDILNIESTIQDPIPQDQHKLEMLAYKAELEQQLRKNQEKQQIQLMDVISERDQLKNKIEVLEIQKNALVLQLDLQNNGKVQKQNFNLSQDQDSSENFELQYQISTGVNTVEVPEQLLKQKQVKDIVLQVPNDSSKSISTSVVPWLLASETTSRILSDRHQKLLEILQQKEAQITQIISTITKQAYQVVKYQKIAEESTQQKELNGIQLLNLQRELTNLEKQKQLQNSSISEMKQNFENQISSLELLNIRQQKQLEIYENQIKTSRDTFFEEFQLLERMDENQKIGYLQNQVIYLSNFEKIYAKTLSDLTKRNKSLEQSNEELRMYNIQFNAKLHEVKYNAEEKVAAQFKNLLNSYEEQQNGYHQEISQLKFNLESKCNEIQLILSIESKLKSSIEMIKKQNQHLFDESLQQQTQIVNLHAQYNILRRQFVDCINEKQKLQNQANDSIDIINLQKDQFIKMQIDNEILVNALKISIQDLYFKIHQKKCDNYLQDIILNSNAVQTDEQLENIGIKTQIDIDLALPNLYELKVFQQEVKLTELEKSVLNQNSLDMVELQMCDFAQTVDNLQETQQAESIIQAPTIRMIDFSQKVEFHTDQSFLLLEAYKEIGSLKQQLTDYNNLMKRFNHIKQKIFEECYYEDVEMVRKAEENIQMTNEDISMQQFRFKNLFEIWSQHQCPTFEDFKPIVDQMLEKLRYAKDEIINQLNITNDISGSQIITLQDEIQFQKDKYQKLRLLILNVKYDLNKDSQIFHDLNLTIIKKTDQLEQTESKIKSSMTFVENYITEEQKRKSIVYLAQYVQTDEIQEKQVYKQISYNGNTKKQNSTSQENNLKQDAKICLMEDKLIDLDLQQSDSKFDNEHCNNSVPNFYNDNKIIGKNQNFTLKDQISRHEKQTELFTEVQNNTCVVIPPRSTSQVEYFENMQLNNTSVSSIDFRRPESARRDDKLNTDFTYGQDVQIQVYFNENQDLLLKQQESHNILLKEISQVSNSLKIMEMDKVTLQKQIDNKSLIIDALRDEIIKKQEEFQFKYVHRPAREEDLAQIKYLSKQLDSYKSWYSVVSQENTKLIKQIDHSEKQMSTFFGSMFKTSQQQNLIGQQKQLTKDQLIEQRKQSDTTINSLFIQEQFQGGLQNMPFVEHNIQQNINQQKQNNILKNDKKAAQKVIYKTIQQNLRSNSTTSRNKVQQNNQKLYANSNNYAQQIEKQSLQKLDQLYKQNSFSEPETQNYKHLENMRINQPLAEKTHIQSQYQNFHQPTQHYEDNSNKLISYRDNQAAQKDIDYINQRDLNKPISIWERKQTKKPINNTDRKSIYKAQQMSTQDLSSLLKDAVDNIGQYDKVQPIIPQLQKSMTSSVFYDDLLVAKEEQRDESLGWTKGGFMLKNEHQNQRLKNLRYSKQLPGNQ